MPMGRVAGGLCDGDLLEIKAESFGFWLETQRRVQAMGTVSGVAFVG